MSLKRKVFFFDIDGTIRSESDRYIPESTIDAIKKLRLNGNKVFVNTGRTFSNIDEEIRSIGFDGYVCGCGTEIILNDKPFYRKINSLELCKSIIDAVCDCGCVPIYERSDVLMTDRRAGTMPEMEELLQDCVNGGATAIDINDTDDICFDKFVIWFDDNMDIERFRHVIANHFEYIGRGSNFAEMIPLDCNKASGMSKVLQEMGVESKDSIAFGDSLNDAAMLEAAGLGIAMGGSKPLYKYADYVTKELEMDGISYALKEYGFI